MSHLSANKPTPFSHGGKVDNNDMNMRPESLAHMDARVRTAMNRAKIKETFYRYEAVANRSKRWHDRGGKLSLVVLVAVLEFALLRLVAERFGLDSWPEGLNTAAVLLGIVPFACTLALHFGGVHERWVEARFKTERIRHWKLQQLLDGAYVEKLGPGRAPDEPDPVFDRRWQALMDDLEVGVTQIEDYVTRQPFTSPFLHQAFEEQVYRDPETFRSAAEVYRQFRLMVQIRWFEQECGRYGRADRRTENLAWLLLVLSAAAAFAEGVLHLLHVHSISNPYVDPGLAVAGIGMTVLSAGVRVYRSASGISESAERYQRLSANLRWYRHGFDASLDHQVIDPSVQRHLLHLMEDIERLCHGEFTEFIRVVRKSDYLM